QRLLGELIAERKHMLVCGRNNLGRNPGTVPGIESDQSEIGKQPGEDKDKDGEADYPVTFHNELGRPRLWGFHLRDLRGLDVYMSSAGAFATIFVCDMYFRAERVRAILARCS